MLQTSTVADLSCCEALAALALFPKRRAYGSAAGDFMVPTASALFTAASSDELRAAGMRLGSVNGTGHTGTSEFCATSL